MKKKKRSNNDYTEAPKEKLETLAKNRLIKQVKDPNTGKTRIIATKEFLRKNQ